MTTTMHMALTQYFCDNPQLSVVDVSALNTEGSTNARQRPSASAESRAECFAAVI